MKEEVSFHYGDEPHLAVWTGNEAVKAAFAAFLERARPRLPTELDPDEVGEASIPRPGDGRVSVLSTCTCGPHVDETHKQWALLGILAASPSHRIGTTDQYRPEGEPEPDITGQTRHEVAVQAGDIVMMSLHHVHWLTGRDDEPPLYAIALDRDRQPSQAEAESAMLKLLQPFLTQATPVRS